MASKLEKPTIICHIEKDLNYTLYDCKWIPQTAKFVVVGAHPRGHGILQVFEVGTNELKSINQIEAPNSLKCGTFGATSSAERHLATGDFKGNLQIWDLVYNKTTFETKAHDEIINTIDGLNLNGPPEVATGSRDGVVKLWDIRQKDKPVAVFQPSDGEVKRDCWAVTLGNSFGDDERVLGAAYDNGDVKLFDLKQMKMIWEKNVKNGVCSLQFDRKDIKMNKLLVTTLESKFHVFDCRTLHPTKGFASVTEKAHKSTVWIGQHLPQNRDLFMTTGGNGSLSLWKYCYPEKRVKQDSEGADYGVAGTLELLQNMTLSSQPLSSFDWCAGKIGLAICTSFDQCIRLIIVTKLNLF